MQKNTKIILSATLATLAVGFAALLAYNYQNKTSFKYSENEAPIEVSQNAQDPVNKEIIEEAKKLKEVRQNSNLTKVLEKDFVLGDANAKVTVIEYASLSCPHCASFSRESFERLKEEYISSGKVKFVYRNFPLNHPALMAAMFSKCSAAAAPDKAAKYYEITKVLFKTQDNWAFDEKFKDKLASIAQLDGMSGADFEKCVNNQKLQEEVLKERTLAAQNLQLRSTPTFFINGEISEGYVDYVSLKKLIDKKLSE